MAHKDHGVISLPRALTGKKYLAALNSLSWLRGQDLVTFRDPASQADKHSLSVTSP